CSVWEGRSTLAVLTSPGACRRAAVLRMVSQIAFDPVGACDRVRQEGDGLPQALVGLGTTETQEALPRRPEALAAQASDAEMVVRAFQQVHGQAVRLDPQPPANGGHVRKGVEGPG